MADIEKAFLQIGINDVDRDRVRFLWLKNPTVKNLEHNIQVYRFARVLFGLNCSPSLLAQVIQHHLQKIGTAAASKIQENLYVDNVFSGVDSSADAKKFYTDSKRIFESAYMNLRCWASNSQDFMNTIPDKDKVQSTTVKVLGVKWNTEKDTVVVAGPDMDRINSATTKREILSCISSVFDPLGWFAPCTIPSKCVLQEVSRDKQSWDAKVTSLMSEKWKESGENLAGIKKIEIPRRIFAAGGLMLAAFCDASGTSFATTMYLICNDGSQVKVNLLLAKSRLNPAKKLSIPRLELMGVLIGTRGLKFVEDELRVKVSDKYLFCDSTCVLSWVKSHKQLDVFVRNRLKEITTKVPGLKFRYVKTDHNPADWATRGRRPDELTEFWWNGPEWLKTPATDWPSWEFDEFVAEEYKPAKKKIVFESGLVAQEETKTPFDINAANVSSLTKLLRVTAWCLRFVKKLQRKPMTQSGKILTVQEIDHARMLWDKIVQTSSYGLIIAKMKQKRNHPMADLGLFLDENGVIRCKARLGNAPLPWLEKYPKLLPKNHSYSTLVVRSIHKSQGHASIKHTLNALRKEYWIPRGRVLVSGLVKKCAVCRKAVGKAYATPMMPELPPSRVNPHPSFEKSGVDYFGPVKLRGLESTKKAWVCLFTCLSTRAVHLELVEDMTSNQFLLALRRFIARRGRPKYMVSDNGAQFKLVSKMLEKAWKSISRDPDVLNFCANTGISWHFITELAPFMGGVYERMVGVVKESLRKTIGHALLSSQQFQTLLCETEALVNSRPITYVGSENVNVLTPAHFLNPNHAVASPDLSSDCSAELFYGATAQDLVENWKKGQNLLEEFWRVWLSEYLNMLRERSKYQHPHTSRLALLPKVGHMVLLKDDRLPRGSWRIGRLIEIHASPDQKIRSVSVQLPSGRKLRRPVGLLVPFETEIIEEDIAAAGKFDKKLIPKVDDSWDDAKDGKSGKSDKRQTRAAARDAKEKISQLFRKKYS